METCFRGSIRNAKSLKAIHEIHTEFESLYIATEVQVTLKHVESDPIGIELPACTVIFGGKRCMMLERTRVMPLRLVHDSNVVLLFEQELCLAMLEKECSRLFM